MSHTFHIPVLGLGYSIDTPLKVSRFGISSVLSIVDDELTERMREYHSRQNQQAYEPISKSAPDSRARRITAYLNLLAETVDCQFAQLKNGLFEAGSELCRYFELLPEKALLRQGYDLMMEYPDCERKTIFQNILLDRMTKGAIDVNIMSKVDKMNFTAEGEFTGNENTDALAALRGFAQSKLESSVILSAGMNPRLYSYLESFEDFLPDKNGKLRKRIILKVSDFRSAFIQAKFLAKKGLWVSEFRVESGLNCGGHAFATEGYLLGPILEEFRLKRQEMIVELYELFSVALLSKGRSCTQMPKQRLSVQGGIGTADENNFLMEHYQLDATGWGSPFLLVPEATNVDESTLMQLSGAKEADFYLSGSSPLGILFNNFKPATMEHQRIDRLEKGHPGSPCTKKYLCTNTEFTEQPICTASREYQYLKLQQLNTLALPENEYQEHVNSITAKICLCEGLCSSVYLKYQISKPKENKAVSICPGPNMAYFSRIYSLDEMAGHIYGKLDLLENIQRPHIFLKELDLYIDYLQADIAKSLKGLNDKKRRGLDKFKSQLLEGISYYKALFRELPEKTGDQLQAMLYELSNSELKLQDIFI
jgi:hypothetical protein